MNTLLRFALAGVVCAGTASCREVSDPRHTDELQGDFVLVRMNGAELPAGSVQMQLVADTLHFDGAGNATHSWTVMEQTGTSTHVDHLTVHLSYEVSGADLRLTIQCLPFAECVSVPQGTIMDANHLITYSQNTMYEYSRA